MDEFPAMVAVSLASAEAILMVFSVADLHSFEEVSRLRDLVHSVKGDETPIVVVYLGKEATQLILEGGNLVELSKTVKYQMNVKSHIKMSFLLNRYPENIYITGIMSIVKGYLGNSINTSSFF